jgi:hypothetical protein
MRELSPFNFHFFSRSVMRAVHDGASSRTLSTQTHTSHPSARPDTKLHAGEHPNTVLGPLLSVVNMVLEGAVCDLPITSIISYPSLMFGQSGAG